jgi:hypothetical protein
LGAGVLAFVASMVLAAHARAAAGGSELLGFPSEDSPSPACVASGGSTAHDAAHAMTMYAGVEWQAPVTPVTPPSRRAVRAVRARHVPVAPAAPEPPDDPSPAAGRRAAHLDTTIVVRPGMRLVLNNFGGSIAIRTWARNAVRVRADHSRRDWIEIGHADGALRVVSTSRMGPASSVTYDLTVPTWLPVALSGIYNDVSVDGLQNGIDVETVRGDIVVRHAAGLIGLRSVEGVVDLVGARGTIAVSSVNEAVRVADAAGSIAAEAVNGDIHLLNIDSKDVEATTINGDVVYDSRILDGGEYRFATHNGDIALALAKTANATVNVSTFSGEFASAFAITPRRTSKGQRFNFVLGNGAAKIDLESFQGAIELTKLGQGLLRTRVLNAWKEHERDFAKEWKWELKGAPAPDEGDDDGQ